MKKHVPFLLCLLSVMVLLGWTATVRAQCLQDKVALDLRITGSLADLSAYAHTITPVGNPSYANGYDGSANGAITLSTGKYLNIAASPAFEPMTDAFTISAWVYPTALASYNSVITKLNVSHRDIDMRVHADGKLQVHFTRSTGGISAITTDAPVVSVNGWTHVAATWDGLTMRLYVNGTEVKEADFVDGPEFQSAGAVSIGALGGNEGFIGSIDYVHLRSYQMDGADIQCLMAEPVALSEGIVLDLPMDASADDVSSNDNDGSLITVGNAENRFGETNSALNFQGTGHVYVPNIAAYNALSSAFTISAWINPSEVGGINTIVGKANSGRDIVLRVHDGKLTAHFYVTGYVWCSAPTATISANEWTHVACTWDGTTMSLYQDGNLLISLEPTSSPSFTSAAWSIGSLTTSGSEMFTGQIDEFRVWDRSLSACEVQSGIHASLDLVAEDDLVMCPGQNVTVETIGSYCSYLWTNDNSTNTSFNIDASSLGVGDHQIVLEAYDYNDHFYSDTVNVSVSSCTGIDETNSSNVMRLMPNPATNVVTVSSLDLSEIQVLDVSGRLLQRHKVSNPTNTDIDVSRLPSGVYFVKCVREDGTYLSQRLMKQ